MSWRPKGYRNAQLRQRIDVQSPTETTDSYGEPVVTAWSTTFEDEPASVEFVSGGETMRGRQVESSVNALFTVRFREGYTTQQSVSYNGDRYGIVHIAPVDGGRRYIELQCRHSGEVTT